MFVMCTHVSLHVLCMSLQNLGGGITANFSPRTHTLLPRSPSMDLHPSSMQRVMWWWDENWRLSSLVEVMLPSTETAFTSFVCVCSDCVCDFMCLLCPCQSVHKSVRFFFYETVFKPYNHEKPLWFPCVCTWVRLIGLKGLRLCTCTNNPSHTHFVLVKGNIIDNTPHWLIGMDFNWV